MTESDLAGILSRLIDEETRIDHIFCHVKVNSAGGRVTLSGEVGSLRDKRIVDNIAQSMGGVEDVHDHVRVRQRQISGDQQLRQRILDSFAEDPVLRESALDVTVTDGDVRLMGEVNALVDKKLAEATVWWLRGVRYVVNDIRVNQPERESDDQIVEAVRAVMDKDSLIDSESVWMGVHGGVVSLSGSLPSEERRQAAEYDSWSVPGVRDVRNSISIVQV